MAEATTRLVKFTAKPPALLEAAGTTIEAGSTGYLPAALAEELAANPHTQVALVDEAVDESEPAPADAPEKE